MSKVYRSTIKDIVVIEPKVIYDSRGYFLESFSKLNVRRHWLQSKLCTRKSSQII